MGRISSLSLVHDLLWLPPEFLSDDNEVEKPLRTKARRVDSGYASITADERESQVQLEQLLVPETPRKTRLPEAGIEKGGLEVRGCEVQVDVPHILVPGTPQKPPFADSGYFGTVFQEDEKVGAIDPECGSQHSEAFVPQCDDTISEKVAGLDYQHEAIPPFLFRTASEKSRGLNTRVEMDPLRGYSAVYHESINEFSAANPAALTDMIWHHVCWKYQVPSEFTSWSASLLYVLVHAIRRKYYDQYSQVLVFVMDTSKLDHSRINSASRLIDKHNVALPATQYYDFAEYLVHGKLINDGGLWKAVHLDVLINAGLCRKNYVTDSEGLVLNELCYVFPTINKPSGLNFLAGRVEGLRRGYFENRMDNIGERLNSIVRVGQCFGLEWQGVIIIALLASRQRKLDVDALHTLLKAIGPIARLPEHSPWPEAANPNAFQGIRDCVETRHFMELLSLMVTYRHICQPR